MARVLGQHCLEFEPERRINEKGELNYEIDQVLYLQVGHRICPRKEMAFSVMNAVAATIVYNYHVQVVETRPVILKVSIILEMKHVSRARINSTWLEL
ncbi:unnamed protein product [Dovyalis caffra]|uniref:Cytochrome P450 n=1 Tax=Dovyalis caffra TaxID=77055 RepID=A0AAV1QYA0_9ROSI|nr:unnamed protein product [Dovyalis caffra]